MNKSGIRKKIFNLRKKKYFEFLPINQSKFIKFLEKKNINNKIIGGYYPFNFELNILNILEYFTHAFYLPLLSLSLSLFFSF